MGCASKREKAQLMLNSKKPHFFKIILDDAICSDNKLVIPRRFVRKHGKELLGSVVLKIPGGSNWRVDLTKRDGEVSFSNGWKDFADYYALKRGHFLDFEYDLSSCFAVVIFDTSATEIDYPRSTINGVGKTDLDKEYEIGEIKETKFDETVSVLDDNNSFLVEKDQSRLWCNGSRKRKRANSACSETITKLDTSVPLDQTRRSHKDGRRREPFTREERKEALLRAQSSFNSDNPYFFILMQPAYVFASYLRIPIDFAKKHLKEHGIATIQVQGGQSSNISFQVRNSSASFNTNWKGFVRDNNLKVGDIVAFELIKDEKIVFNVSTISSVTKNVKCGMQVDLESGASGYKTSECSKSQDLCANHDIESSKFASEGKSKLMKENASANMQFVERLSCSNTPENVETTSGFASRNPYFTVVTKRWNLKVSIVFLPQSFVVDIVKKSQTVELQVADKVWTVKLQIYPRNGGALSYGWDAFARDNDLQVGDVCKYELIQNDPMILHVSITKYVLPSPGSSRDS